MDSEALVTLLEMTALTEANFPAGVSAVLEGQNALVLLRPEGPGAEGSIQPEIVRKGDLGVLENNLEKDTLFHLPLDMPGNVICGGSGRTIARSSLRAQRVRVNRLKKNNSQNRHLQHGPAYGQSLPG